MLDYITIVTTTDRQQQQQQQQKGIDYEEQIQRKSTISYNSWLSQRRIDLPSIAW